MSSNRYNFFIVSFLLFFLSVSGCERTSYRDFLKTASLVNNNWQQTVAQVVIEPSELEEFASDIQKVEQIDPILMLLARKPPLPAEIRMALYYEAFRRESPVLADAAVLSMNAGERLVNADRIRDFLYCDPGYNLMSYYVNDGVEPEFYEDSERLYGGWSIQDDGKVPPLIIWIHYAEDDSEEGIFSEQLPVTFKLKDPSKPIVDTSKRRIECQPVTVIEYKNKHKHEASEDMLRACYAYLILNKYFQENWGLDYYQPELPTMEAYKRLGKTKADISPFLKVESLGNSTYRISVGQPFLERLKCLIAEERGE